MQEGICYVYILASKRNGTLYIGVTNSILNRIHEHKIRFHPQSFTSRYNVTNLVYYEIYQDIKTAIYREKQLKKWKRIWKIELIETVNPIWKDLYSEVLALYD